MLPRATNRRFYGVTKVSERSRSTRGSRPGSDYRRLLTEFRAEERPPVESTRFLMSQGFTRGQARNAVYRYRQDVLRARDLSSADEGL